VDGAARSAREHDLSFEELDAAAVRRRFPGLQPDDSWVAVFEPRAGVLLPETCVRTLLNLAQGYGARVITGTGVDAWRVDAEGDVVIHTAAGEIRARHAVFAAGPWLNAVLAGDRSAEGAPVQLPLTVQRQVSCWFRPAPGVHAFRYDACPITIWEHQPGRFFYTLPDIGHGVKVGIHFEGAEVLPDQVDRSVHSHEELHVRQLLDTWMPGAAHSIADADVCLYTMTPDGHFIVDQHPEHARILLLSPCSGHGFKFAPAIGEAAADVLMEGGSGFDLSPFSIARFR
jgi:glycine/D-amino acid oxidase-like deaminating enzyme